ncbi:MULTISPECIES: DUF6385 domain-containing protein [unclassified Sedimentibacter]|uniref:DUF6385 domain-containing protein n=1 Tax=unclassified Sedimentibacter TaxID=2649220 RepID=UPI0027DEE45A|nr:DUF6385 domain-containing protein [Sedimentibacter sp. MB35-C1]WMJ76515.1 DUF6385 domain-containing protein [Sedimentibacter sp. MB35-C1]
MQVDDTGNLPVNGTVDIATGAEVTLAAGTDIDTVSTITNDVKVVNGTTPLTETTVGLGATVNSDSQDVSLESSYNWFIKNTGTTSSDQDITLKVEISPDNTTWLEDTGTVITVPFDTAKMITITNFLQYVRFVITGGAAETTVISCFQAQH